MWKGGWEKGALANPIRHLRRWDKWSKGEEVKESELIARFSGLS